jgi:hypothetical protein
MGQIIGSKSMAVEKYSASGGIEAILGLQRLPGAVQAVVYAGTTRHSGLS